MRSIQSKRLDADFFACHTVTVARELLGKYLLTPGGGGQIIETEAYRQQDDPACHAFDGRQTHRNQSMFLAPGHLYVYRIHQVFCLNITTEAEGLGCAVLIRGLWPTEQTDQMLARRPVKRLQDLSNGPGKLCQALGIDRGWDGLPLGTQLWLEDRGLVYSDQLIQTGPRIGIRQGLELPWRFWLPSGQLSNSLR